MWGAPTLSANELAAPLRTSMLCKGTGGGGKRRKHASQSQSALSQAVPQYVARANELKRKAQDAADDEPTRGQRQRHALTTSTVC